MKPELFRYPEDHPNDREGFLGVYKEKFPAIVNEYEGLVREVHLNPQAFAKIAEQRLAAFDKGWERIEKLYASRPHTLEFLVKIDMMTQKLNCFNFWLINYMLCEGPLHYYYIDRIKHYVSLLFGRKKDVAEAEKLMIQTDNLSNYLIQTFGSLRVVDELRYFEETGGMVKEIEGLKGLQESYSVLDRLIAAYEGDRKAFSKAVVALLDDYLQRSRNKKTLVPIYSFLLHGIRYYKENLAMKERHAELGERIKEVLELAKLRLGREEYEEFKNSYEINKLFARYKDVYGDRDPRVLKAWFGWLNEIREMLSKQEGRELRRVGQGGLFYEYGKYLPEKLRAHVFQKISVK